MFVRFYPTSYTTTESQGSVTVWVHVDEGVSQPFTVALLPGEGDVILLYSCTTAPIYIKDTISRINSEILLSGV